MAAYIAVSATAASCATIRTHGSGLGSPTTISHQFTSTLAGNGGKLTAPPVTPACSPEALLDNWSISSRAAQLIIVPAQEDNVGTATPEVAMGAGGIILFGSQAPTSLRLNITTLDQSALGGIKPLVMTDEEGGEIQRMANLVGNMPWPRTMTSSMSLSEVQSLATTTATKMRASGVTMDLAPVLDLSDSPGPNAQYPDGPRSFSTNPSIATSYGLAFAQGLEAGGVIPVVKHFPGLGQATGNTDDEEASVPAVPILQQSALLPFQAAIEGHLPAIMVSNASITGLTNGQPASLSSAAITGLLRDKLGFSGLVMTDSLSALSISDMGYSVPQAAVAAIAAGADMIMYNSDNPLLTFTQTLDAIVSAVASGTIPTSRFNYAVEKVLAIKGVNVCPKVSTYDG